MGCVAAIAAGPGATARILTCGFLPALPAKGVEGSMRKDRLASRYGGIRLPQHTGGAEVVAICVDRFRIRKHSHVRQ
jgi:hypothetical protein